MELDTVQKKLVLSKQLGINLLKGKTSSGKTTAAVHRAIYLKNQYCLYEDDKILIVSDSNKDIQTAQIMYNKISSESETEYSTLFSKREDNLSFYSIKEIVYKYFNLNRKKNKYNIISDTEKINIISKCLHDVKKNYKNVKFLHEKYTRFFIDEISWIKCCNYTTLEEYQNAERTGRKVKKGEGPSRIFKNSNTREAIFNLMLLYNEILEKSKSIDCEDIDIIALEQVKTSNDKFTHIIIDEFQNFTKVQFEIIKLLLYRKAYFSMTLVDNKDISLNCNAWFIKGKKLNRIGVDGKIKTYNLKNTYKSDLELKTNMKSETENYEDRYSIETFEYHDIRHNRKFNFIRDINDICDVIVKEEDKEYEYEKDELRELAVYNDIAAGEPILINSDIENKFYMPKYWLKGINDCFILKVKGESMIGANIFDGDYVVIRKQYSAQNKDIVAVEIDGSATLKRLSISKEGINLMPENSRFSPIPVTDDGTNIIGIAIGIIKGK
ncbi:S24 family peptidase [Clostridium thailandense]|uniref:S24 family peptidase n=1 Tax=Clostridium thailandense TaxID=2794346 RepID=UPI00398978E1